MILYTPCRVEWRKIETNMKTGEVTVSDGTNIVVNAGRTLLLTDLFGLTASAGVVCVAVGSSSTPATVSDTHLTYEILGANMRRPLTNTSGATLSPSDIVDDPITVSSVNYYKKLVAQAEWAAGLGTGYVFGEYMLNTSITQPETPTGTSGIMFNHYIDPSPSNKGADTLVQIQISVRF